ncbi:GNAT family N-acetyltransferase [Catalinimonas sp. 4WD22]|uniref:GNAT family N-acetyltransferase n=1 Tax=Catalinimonas locisalis TaxID=3133978 RepID=UPI0031011F4E
MENLRFVTEENPERYPLLAETYLYNSKAYLKLKVDRLGRPLSFYALKGELAVARTHFFIRINEAGEKEANSSPESPFGSLEYSNELSEEILRDFISYIKTALLCFDVKQIIMKDCISKYRKNSPTILHPIFLDMGFQKQSSMMNHHIEVDEGSLEQQMHKMERKRLRKARRLGLNFREEPLSSIDHYYHFLQECRQEKGWSLTLSYAETLASVQAMPERYRIFVAYHEDKCVAASLSVVVKKGILYDFYHDSKAAYKTWSPVVFLVDGMYQYCQKNKFDLLDLGTSTTQSLQQFKQHLGGVTSQKYTYLLRL